MHKGLGGEPTWQGVRGVVEGDEGGEGGDSEAGREDALVDGALPDVEQVAEVARGALVVLPVRGCEEGGDGVAAGCELLQTAPYRLGNVRGVASTERCHPLSA